MPEVSRNPKNEFSAWPTVDLKSVFHVGALDPSKKGQTHNSTSLEGNGLSVSLDPDAWRHIASLGGEQTWMLTQEKAASFLDAAQMSQEHWGDVMAWAQRVDLVEPTEIVEVSWFDDEAQSRVTCEYDAADIKSHETALMEMHEHQDMAARIRNFNGFRSTPSLDQRIGFLVDVALVKDMVLTLYVEDVLYPTQRVQGVWWHAELDIYALSASRGVIHPQALAEWAHELVDEPLNRQTESANPSYSQ
ncbi:hypothetical protein [Polaromonas sp.]|uniref:hypothetical protein n=1 Tax=Polaromonas sp. TaxID=1869339 RepID=UPI00352BBB66